MIYPGHNLICSDWGGIRVDEMDCTNNEVELSIPGNQKTFTARDIKELRKFLKKLQRQLEQADLDTLE